MSIRESTICIYELWIVLLRRVIRPKSASCSDNIQVVTSKWYSWDELSSLRAPRTQMIYELIYVHDVPGTSYPASERLVPRWYMIYVIVVPEMNFLRCLRCVSSDDSETRYPAYERLVLQGNKLSGLREPCSDIVK